MWTAILCRSKAGPGPLGRPVCLVLLLLSIAAGTPSILAQTSSTDIQFFGATIPGEDFVWCLDRSGSMGWFGDFEEMQIEVSATLSTLTPSHEFSLVYCREYSTSWSPTLRVATPMEIDAATLWLGSFLPMGPLYLVEGLAQSISIAEASPNGSVILVGDGDIGVSVVTPPESILADIISVNPNMVPIHTVYMGPWETPSLAEYFQSIASQSGGTFVDTNPPRFRRGDANNDDVVDISDGIFLLASYFIPGSPPPQCESSADTDDSGAVELVDAIVLIQSFFVPSAPPIAAPRSSCAIDPTPDALTCTASPCP